MVFKEDIVKWFKQLSSYKRIDVMCSLLNMCLPFELRYLGTCLEDLGKRDFKELRDSENRANNVSELSELQVLSDKRTQGKIALYLSLLHSCNYACSNTLYKVLANFDVGEISTIVNNNTTDENPLEELMLIYTLAMNHPAFTFEQKSVFVNIFLKLQEEESKWFASKHPHVGMSLVYVKPPIQACIPPCQGSEEQQEIVFPCPTISLPPGHAAGADMSKARPALGFHPGLSLAHDAQGTGYMQVAFPSPQPLPSVPWQPAVMMCGALPVASDEPGPPYPLSPCASRQSSPSQSGSPRSSSPARPRGRHGCKAPGDPLRETLGKEMPGYLSHLQNYSVDELQGMGDEELKKLGLPTGAVHQLRSIVSKLHSTNGLSPLDKREHRRKAEPTDPEQGADRKPDAGVPAVPPHQQLITAPGVGMTCITVPVTTAPSSRHALMQTQQFLHINNNLRNLRLDQADCGRHCSNSSSASDSSSASHSPPDTPSMPPTTPHWERGFMPKECGSREHRSPGTDERERRVPEPSEKASEEAPAPVVPTQATRPRLPGGLGRGKVNPPGMPTLPRSRGPISEGAGHKSLPGCRTAVNGAPNAMPPRPGHDDRKVYEVGQAPVVPQFSVASNPPPRPGEVNVPYTAFLQHFPGLRTTTTAATSIFPAFHHPGSYIRPSYPFSHNGDLVYQYHGPQTPPPPTFVPPVFPAAVPPPKVSCYNCGSGSHLATDCKEATMEEMTKPGQYHIDYVPYQKSGECSSEK
ncbi:proline-rich protein 36-like isoform X2 [Bacillus rossius redtenbacheri]|uniref:proline-rich protein 36-like isoform X2 n=1 Tax=Bacillus rossius redtenbacheri TaxID=93214 RepID=UPI002FDE2314